MEKKAILIHDRDSQQIRNERKTSSTIKNLHLTSYVIVKDSAFPLRSRTGKGYLLLPNIVLKIPTHAKR